MNLCTSFARLASIVAAAMICQSASAAGSCCGATGGCTIVSSSSGCSGGQFTSGGTCTPNSCVQPGACCSDLGACFGPVIPYNCFISGVPTAFQGAGTTCTPNPCHATIGACCFADATCALEGSTTCTNLGGTIVGGLGSTCAAVSCPNPTGACCLGTSCSVGDQADCTNAGGAFIPLQTCAAATCTRTGVCISQFYVSGGGTSSPYAHDFVELYNPTSAPVTMTNWSLQYGAATTVTYPSKATINGTIPANGYFLIQLGNGVSSSGSVFGAALPTPDLDSAQTELLTPPSAGRLALVTHPASLPNGCIQGNASTLPIYIADFVAYGSTATCYNGSGPAGQASAGGSGAYGFFRLGDGCQNTFDNLNDFSGPVAPNPRNSSVTNTKCGSGMGACCVSAACSLVATGSCGGSYLGDGSACTPTYCNLPVGACCNGTSCSMTASAACVSPATYSGIGVVCTANPCTVACCTGTACVLEAKASCTGSSYYITGGSCSPNPCGTPVVVQPGDIAYGASVAANQDSVQQIRGVETSPASRVGTWTLYGSLQVVRFDNAGGILHNAAGNLLGMNFGGSASAGGSINNLPTTTGSVTAGQYILNTTGTTPSLASLGLQPSRTTGLSVSPNNDLIAFTGYDSALIYVLHYNAGSTIGTGSGASIDAGVQTSAAAVPLGFNLDMGTGWLDENTVIAFVRTTDANTISLYTIPVSSDGGSPPVLTLGTPTAQLTIVDADPNASRFLAMAYNPQLVPGYIFAMSSDFQANLSYNTLYVVNVKGGSGNWTLDATHDESLALGTGREVTIGQDRNLYLNEFAATSPTSPLINKLVLDANGDGVVSEDEVLALNSNPNSSTPFYLRGTANASSFSGMDIALSTVGVCCKGSTCVTGATASSCTGPDTLFVSSSASCNAGGVQTTPCCKADFNHTGGITVQDIFDFLSAWFAKNPIANITSNGAGAPTVQSIFDFLSAWFAKGC